MLCHATGNSETPFSNSSIITRSPHLRLLQPIIRNSERKRRLGVNLAPIKFHIFYQVRFWYPLETNVVN